MSVQRANTVPHWPTTIPRPQPCSTPHPITLPFCHPCTRHISRHICSAQRSSTCLLLESSNCSAAERSVPTASSALRSSCVVRQICLSFPKKYWRKNQKECMHLCVREPNEFFFSLDCNNVMLCSIQIA